MLLCTKCKQLVITTDKDFVICCNEVIYVFHETHCSSNEANLRNSR